MHAWKQKQLGTKVAMKFRRTTVTGSHRAGSAVGASRTRTPVGFAATKWRLRFSGILVVLPCRGLWTHTQDMRECDSLVSF